MAAGVIGIRLNLDGVQRAQRGVRDITRDVDRLGDAGRKASRGFADFTSGGITKGMGALKAGIAGVTAAAGLSIVGVGAWLKESVDSLQRIERINAQTANAVKSTGGVAGVTAQHIIDLTGAMEGYTATEAESIQQGANLLLTFTNVKNAAGDGNDIFDRTTAIMNDMARAMDTTGSANLDMSATAIQLGKALNDPVKGVTALRKVGVAFDEQQTKTIKKLTEAGDVMGAQKIILAELQKEFGGSAEAYAKTTAGQVELAKHAIGTLGETVATAALPPLGRLATAGADALNQLATDFSEGTGWIGQLQDRFNDGLSAAKGFRDYVVNDLQVPQLLGDFYAQAKDKATEIINGLRDGVSSGDSGGLAEGIGKGIAGGLNSAFDGLTTYGPKLVGALTGLLAKVDWGGIALEVGKQAPLILLGLATGLLNFDITKIFVFVFDHWKEVLVGVLTIAFAPAKLLGPVAKILGRIPLVGRFIEWLLTAINGVGGRILGYFKNLASTFLRGFMEGWSLGGPGIIARVLGLFRGLQLRLFVWADDALIWFRGLPGRLTDWVGKWGGELGARAIIAWQQLMGSIRNGGNLLVGLLRTIGGWMLTPVRWYIDNILKPIVTFVLNDLPAGFRQGFDLLLDPVRKVFDKITDLKNLISGGLTSAWNGISGGIGSVVGRITGARAAGGPVASGHTYLVGERGPELFTANRSGTVIDNAATMRSLKGSLAGALPAAAGGPLEVTVHTVATLDGQVAFESWQKKAAAARARA